MKNLLFFCEKKHIGFKSTLLYVLETSKIRKSSQKSLEEYEMAESQENIW